MHWGALFAGAGLSVLLPWILGYAAVTAVARRVLSVGERVGLAYPCGAVWLTLTIYVAGHFGMRFSRGSFVLAALVPALALMVVAARRRVLPHRAPSPANLPAPGWIVTGTLAALLGVKVAFVLFEVLHRPLSPWDSFSVWGLRAKVWAARGGLVLDRHDPFYLGTAVRPDYPPHVSLLQTWTAIWLGQWHDVLVNLPWGCYYLAALLLVYATVARRLARSWALPAAFLLAGTPLFLVHAAIAGYADLILSLHFAAAALAVYLWATERQPALLAVAAFFIASLPFIKLEGIVLAVACIGAIAAQARILRRAGLRWLLFPVAAGLAFFLGWRNSALHALLLRFAFHTEAAWPLLRSFFGMDNWHLLWLLFFAVTALRLKAIWGTPLAWLLATVIAPMVPFGYVFLCTDAAQFAVQQTAQSRVFLSLLPAALLFVLFATGQAWQGVDQILPDRGVDYPVPGTTGSGKIKYS